MEINDKLDSLEQSIKKLKSVDQKISKSANIVKANLFVGLPTYFFDNDLIQLTGITLMILALPAMFYSTILMMINSKRFTFIVDLSSQICDDLIEIDDKEALHRFKEIYSTF